MTRKKKTVLLITGISLLFLLTPVGLSLLLQLPGVQNFIVHKTIDVVNKRIQGTIALSRIGIAMPGSIVLEDLLIRDPANDTIIRASRARVRINLIGLPQGIIHIRSIRLSDCSVVIRREHGDRKFNIEHLFSAKTSPGTKKSSGKKAGGRKISLDAKRVYCRNVRFTFDDRKSGVRVETRAGRLDLKMDRLALDKLQFDVNDLKLDSSFCAVRIFKKGPPHKKSKRVINLPQITVKSLGVTNASFVFEDTIARNTIQVGAGGIFIEKGDVDLNGQAISAHSVLIKGAGVGLGLTAHAARPHPADTAVPKHKPSAGNRWRISAGLLDLGESRFDFDFLNKPRQKPGFDAAHMHFSNIAVKASNAFYSAREIRAKLAHAAALDSNTVELKKCAVDFSMDEKGISAQNLSFKSAGTDLHASVTTGFSPFNKKFMDSLPNLPVMSIFKPSSVSTHEIRLFFPALAGTPLFKGDDKIIRFSAALSGPVKSLKGDKINVSYGKITNLQTNFLISRLPDVKNMLFDIPALTLTTGRDDMASLLGKNLLPRDLSLPSHVRLDASFNGVLHAFRSTLRASLDNSTFSVNVTLDSMKRYTGAITVSDLNPGLMFPKVKKIGRMTLSATIDGQGFDPKKLSANVSIDAPSVQFNNYTYRNIKLEARADSQRYQGTLSVKDENVSLALNGDFQTANDHEAVRCKLDLQGADFRKLQLLKDSLTVSARIEADLKGRHLNTLSGMLNMTDITLVKNGIAYRLDSAVCAIATSSQNQTVSIHSAILDARYDGAMPVDKAFKDFGRQVLAGLPLNRSAPDTARAVDWHDMSLDVTVHDHPLLNGLLLPELTLLEGANIRVGYSEADKKLKADATVRRGEYNGISFTGLHTAVAANDNSLSCLLTADKIANARATLTNVEVRGVSRKDRATISVSTVGKNQDTALYAALSVKTSDSGIALALDPTRFFLGGYPWTVKKNNSVLIKGKRIAIHDLGVSRNRSSIAIASVAAADSDVISIAVRDFALKFISQMLHLDSSFVDGTLNGNIDMIRQGGQSALKASASLRDIIVKKVEIGSFVFTAENLKKGDYQFTADLTGQGNDAHIKGSISAGPGERNIDITAAIKSLALRTIEPFTAKAISGSRGFLQGDFACKIAGNRPIMNGKILFKEASLKPAALNSTIHLGNEVIDIKNSGVYFNNFSIIDPKNHPVKVSGAITMDSAGLFWFDLKANAYNFLLLNTTKRNNPVVYGRLVVDFQATIRGTSRFPVIDSRVALKAPSSITFAVPEASAKMDRGENVVVFSGPAESQVPDKSKGGKTAGAFKGIELASEIKVDKGVTLRLIPDPTTLDLLVIRGEGALNLGIEKNGAINLTGTYSMSDGSYTVTLPPLLPKKFTIRSGSTLTWNGKPADANAAIVAQYSVSAAPLDLISNELIAPSEAEKSSYRKPLKFLISLNLNGPLLKPDISFVLDLAPADKGAFSGKIDAKLNQINQDPTALNKQVFALLVLGTFIRDNPLNQSSGNDQLASVARSSVSGFLTAQLNQWGASLLPGVELNVGVQSYDTDTSGLAAGKTMVDLGVRKQLFNDRLSVEVGGTFDVEGGSNGAKENQNIAKDIGGNVAIEYKITRNGRYSLKGFRHTQYEGALDGQVTETGAGVVYSRNFNFWRQLFKRSRKENDEQ